MTAMKKSFGQQTIGGGSSAPAATVTPQSNIYYLVGGNNLAYIGAAGVKKVTSTITSAISGYNNGTPADLPDGIAWIRSLDDNTLKLCVNDATSYTNYDVASQPVYAIKTGTLTGASWSYDKYTICGVF